METIVNGHKTFIATGGRPFDPKKPTVVFLHGAAMDHSCWALQTRYFAHHGRNVIAPDLPGHIRSAGTAPGSVEAYADWVIALLDTLKIAQAALVGHSLGSLIALEVAGRVPDRVTALALVATAAPMAVNDTFHALARDDTPRAIALMMDWSHGRKTHLGGNVLPGLWLVAGGFRQVERAAPGLLFHDLGVAKSYAGGLDAAARVACPTLIVAGDQDMMTPPKASAAVAAAIKGARTVVIRQSGHMMMGERPDETLDALRSLIEA